MTMDFRDFKIQRRGFAALGLSLISAISAPAAWVPAADAGALVVLQETDGNIRSYIAPQRGGGMVGLEYRFQGKWIELLYRGLDFSATSDWDGKAPILWPATGRNFAIDPASGAKQPGWMSNGIFYPMPIHGFARDLPWQVVKQTVTDKGKSVVLVLSDNEVTHKFYPFAFKVTTDYTVGQNSLTIHQHVHADKSNSGPMPFSIGNHMTYKLPLIPGGTAEAVTFVTPATKRLLLTDEGSPSGKAEAFEGGSTHTITELGTRKAWSLTGFPKDSIWVKMLDQSGLSLTVSHEASRQPSGDPVYFNLWGDVAGGFFAPEPWAGKQNSLVIGDGTIRLDPGADFDWTVTVVVN